MTRIDNTFILRRADAIQGSERLRDAILTAKGYPVIKRSTRVRHRKIVTKPKSSFTAPIPPPIDLALRDYTLGIVGPTISIRPRLTVQRIQDMVALCYDIPSIEMVSQRRSRDVAQPRQVAMWLTKQLTPKSLPDIGRRFGNRDHTTILHGIRRTEQRMLSDPDLRADVALLREALAA